MSVTAADLRALPPEEYDRVMKELGPELAEELIYNWKFWARPEQLEPSNKYKIWMPLGGRGWGKDLADKTPIFTPDGWKTMGEIQVGDYVFAWDGSATKVLNLYKPRPRQLVEFTFSDNTTLISSVEHEWVTQDYKERKDRSVWPSEKTRTTQDIIETFTRGSRGDSNHSIPLCKPLNGTRQDEGIKEPYYLGFWLGDGISKSCHEITIGKKDQPFYLGLWPQFEDKGRLIFRAPAEGYQWMRDLNLRCNKHIPEIVFHCIPAVRLEVLKGLMDSDGYAEKSKVEFCTTSPALAEGVLQLVRSLGEKPRLYTGESKLYGRNCGLKFRICWKPNINPFKLPRKATKVKIGGHQDSRNKQRMIVAYRYVDYQPTTCIEVDHPDHLFLAGEGLIPTHNTRTGAETVRDWVKQGHKRIACVAPTKGATRRVMVEGNSGIMSVCSKEDITNRGAKMGYPIWSPTNNTITWENGAKAEFFSAEDPERLRGPQFSAAWCDELAAWRNMQDTWDMLQFTLRLGKNPRVLITTTPKPLKLIRRIIELSKKDPNKYIVTVGSSYENADNIDINALAQYEGTRLGRQELYAEVLEEAAGALWSVELIDKCQEYPEDTPIEDLQRIVVSVDPAITANSESDMTGIIVAGVDVNGHGHVILDATDRYSPSGWAKKAIELYHEYGADRIVAERNQGGDMVRHTLETEDNTVPIRMVHASRGKFARAEPVAALYEQGKVKHYPGLDELESQMVTWEPLGSMGSPDRLDALVWAMTDLMLGGVLKPNLQISYESKSSNSGEQYALNL